MENNSEKLLYAFRKQLDASVIEKLVKEGHRNDTLFWHVHWDEHNNQLPLRFNYEEKLAEAVLRRVLTAIDAGHALPAQIKEQFNLALFMGRAPKQYESIVFSLFERMVEEGMIGLDDQSHDHSPPLLKNDVVLSMFSLCAHSGNVNLMKHICTQVGGIESLLSAQSAVNHFCPFSLALKRGKYDVLDWLYTQFKPEQWKHEKKSDHTPKHVEPLLQQAIYQLKDIKMYRYLIEQGEVVWPNIMMDFLNNISLGEHHKHSELIDVMALFLEQGACLENEEQSCFTALIDHYKIEDAKPLFDYLVSQGADINWKTQSTQQTLLMRALHTNHFELGSLLLDCGVDIHALDHSGQNALFINLTRQRSYSSPVLFSPTARRLIEMGADIHALDRKGKSPAQLLSVYELTWVDEVQASLTKTELQQTTRPLAVQKSMRRI